MVCQKRRRKVQTQDTFFMSRGLYVYPVPQPLSHSKGTMCVQATLYCHLNTIKESSISYSSLAFLGQTLGLVHSEYLSTNCLRSGQE